MSKRRDIRHHDEIQDRLDILQAGIATLIDYHEQANNQRVAEIKLNAKPAGFNWHAVAVDKDQQLTEAIRSGEEWKRLAKQKVDAAQELAEERATLAKRVAFLESACDEWAEKCRADKSNLSAQISTLQTGMDNWQKEAGKNYDRAQAMETDRDLWQARANNACQRLSELDTDNRYNGIQVDCPETREHLDRILRKFLLNKKTAVHFG